MKISPDLKRSALIFTLALAVTPYFIGLGASSLWDSNEAFYAETPREMIEARDYINPSFNYRPRFNKPPLVYWIVASSYNLFGVSEKAERLPIAIGAIVMIATAFAIGRLLFSTEAGLLAAIALAIAPRFVMFSRRIIIDVYLAMFMGLALLFFLLAERYPARRRLCLVLMYISIGLGVLTKGPVAVVLPAASFLIYLSVCRQLNRLRSLMVGSGAIIVVVIVLPWYVSIYCQHGWHYIESFLLRDNISRYTEPVWGPRRGLFFYLPVLIGDMFPWSVFLFPALWLAISRKVKPGLNLARAEREITEREITERETHSDKRSSILLPIWIAVIVVFFSLSSNKEDLYILPAYTAAAALIGGLLSSYTSGGSRLPVRITVTLLAILIVAAGVGTLYLFGGTDQTVSLPGASVIGYTALVGGLASSAAILFNRRLTAVIVMALTIVALNFVFVLRTLPDFERYKPVRPLCEMISLRAAPDAMIGYYRFASPSMVFYLRRPIFEYYKEEELRAALASGKEVYFLMTARDYEAIKQSLPSPIYILASAPVFQVKLKGILDRTELPQVMLISNKGGAIGSE